MGIEMFVSAEDTVVVSFVIGADKDNPKVIYCDLDEQSLKEINPVDESTIERHKIVFRKPNFDDISKILDDSTVVDGISLKPAIGLMRINRMIRLLKSWTLPRPATAQEIRNLDPSIAAIVATQLENLT